MGLAINHDMKPRLTAMNYYGTMQRGSAGGHGGRSRAAMRRRYRYWTYRAAYYQIPCPPLHASSRGSGCLHHVAARGGMVLLFRGVCNKPDSYQPGFRRNRHHPCHMLVVNMAVGTDMQLDIGLLLCRGGKTRGQLIHCNRFAVPVEGRVVTKSKFDMIRLSDIRAARCLG